MSEKKKTTSTKKTTSKKSSVKATPKKTSTKPKTASKAKTSTTKKSAVKKPVATKKTSKKATTVKAKIVSYRRSNRLQVTNQAIAVILDDVNHKALVGRKFTLNFEGSDAIAKGIVSATHGQIRNKRVRLRFEKGGMAGIAINQIAEIHI